MAMSSQYEIEVMHPSLSILNIHWLSDPIRSRQISSTLRPYPRGLQVDSPVVRYGVSNDCGVFKCSLTISYGSALSNAVVNARMDGAGSRASLMSPGGGCCAVM
jgi:hypothetical protein